jgi:hypothetical protein
MSVWSHITGAVRLDGGLFEDNEAIENQVKEMFGNTCHFYSSEQEWDECNVPCGSEGSLKYEFIAEKDESFIGAGIVLIWGDLRRYELEDWDEIEDWFTQCMKNISESENFFLRDNAILTVTSMGKSLHLVGMTDEDTDEIIVDKFFK